MYLISPPLWTYKPIVGRYSMIDLETFVHQMIFKNATVQHRFYAL